MRRIWSTFVGLFANLLAGLRLALPVPVSRRAFHVRGDQVLLLLLAAAGTTLRMSYRFGDGPGDLRWRHVAGDGRALPADDAALLHRRARSGRLAPLPRSCHRDYFPPASRW